MGKSGTWGKMMHQVTYCVQQLEHCPLTVQYMCIHIHLYKPGGLLEGNGEKLAGAVLWSVLLLHSKPELVPPREKT
jgi:hypothetical protein